MEGPFEIGPSVSRLGEHCQKVVQVKYLVMSKFLKAGSQNLAHRVFSVGNRFLVGV